jgi:hypothetical protein
MNHEAIAASILEEPSGKTKPAVVTRAMIEALVFLECRRNGDSVRDAFLIARQSVLDYQTARILSDPLQHVEVLRKHFEATDEDLLEYGRIDSPSDAEAMRVFEATKRFRAAANAAVMGENPEEDTDA